MTARNEIRKDEEIRDQNKKPDFSTFMVNDLSELFKIQRISKEKGKIGNNYHKELKRMHHEKTKYSKGHKNRTEILEDFRQFDKDVIVKVSSKNIYTLSDKITEILQTDSLNNNYNKISALLSPRIRENTPKNIMITNNETTTTRQNEKNLLNLMKG